MKKIALNYFFNNTLGRQNHVRVLRLSAPKASYNFSHAEEVLNGLNEKDYKIHSSQFMNVDYIIISIKAVFYINQGNSKELGNVLEESSSQRINDVEISDGVIKVTIQGSKTFVINRQVPNRQIWYSSPVRQKMINLNKVTLKTNGPQRFNYDSLEEKWKNQKNEELSKLLFKEIDLV